MSFTKRALWVVLLVLSFAVMAGGCGGGGGGSSESSGGSTAEIDFETLDGTWVATSGSGTASANDEKVTLKLSQGTMEFDLLDLAANEATIRILYDVYWDVYYQNVRVEEVHLSNKGDQVLVQRTGSNKFRYTYSDGSTIDVTVTSNKNATVTERGFYEEGSDRYSYSATYSIEKTTETPL